MEQIFYIFSFLLGLIVGSFLNCLIWRIYKEETIGGRSYCPKCRNVISWFDNIPVLSFIFLGGRCRHCHKTISWQYPLVELITALLFMFTFIKESASPDFPLLLLRDWFLIITLVIIFVYDLRWQLIPVNVLWVMSVFMLAVNILLGHDYMAVIFFGLIGGAFFLIQYLATGKKGVGEGDIWFGLFLGIAFPTAGQLILLMLSSYCIGSIIALILVIFQHKKFKTRIALGPFLAIGALITLFFSNSLIEWYLRLGGLL